MATESAGVVTQLLEDARGGNVEAQERLWNVIYQELHGVAQGMLRQERPDHTLQATALVNEACMRLFVGDVMAKAQNRAYLFGAAARAMRQVLVDHARKRRGAKRGGDWQRSPLDQVLDSYEARNIDLLTLNDALEQLRTSNPRQYQIVDEYHFGGFTMREIAEHLGVSEATVSNDFKRAQLWLATQMAAG
jgi:RNA polymerase sigma factor (TIGR02999 family)